MDMFGERYRARMLDFCACCTACLPPRPGSSSSSPTTSPLGQDGTEMNIMVTSADGKVTSNNSATLGPGK